MADNRLQGRILVFFNWGEFVIWHFGRDLQVSTDGRRETVYSDRHLDGHLEIYKGTEAGAVYFRRLNPDYIWLPVSSGILARAEDAGWARVFEGERSVVLARQDRVFEGRFQRRNRCLTGQDSSSSPIGSGLWRY